MSSGSGSSDTDDGRKKDPPEPDEDPIPPPPPDPPRPPPRTYSSRVAGDYQTLSVPGGTLHFSLTLKQVNAHCGNVDHLGGSKCKMDRRLVGQDGARRRPGGLLMAWLSHSCCHGGKAAHDGLKKFLGKEAQRGQRCAGREALGAMAAQATEDGRKAAAILAMEQEEGGDGEPRVAQ